MFASPNVNKHISNKMKNQTQEAFLTVEQAMELLSLKGNTIRDYCKNGTLKGKKSSVNGQWRIKKSSVEALLNGK